MSKEEKKLRQQNKEKIKQEKAAAKAESKQEKQAVKEQSRHEKAASKELEKQEKQQRKIISVVIPISNGTGWIIRHIFFRSLQEKQ